MPALVKIKRLKSFNFFSDFAWDDRRCPDTFARFNIIYGWNGSGKSTLCDFFKAVEVQKTSPGDSQVELLVAPAIGQPTTPITNKNISTLAPNLRVFDQDYVQHTINIDSISHIFTVGEEQKQFLDIVKLLSEKISKLITQKERFDSEFAQKEAELDNLAKQAASEIRSSIGFPSTSYTKKHFWNDFESAICVIELDQVALDKATMAVRSKEQEVIKPIQATFPLCSDFDELKESLGKSPSHCAIDELVKNYNLSRWVEQGFFLHQEENLSRCLYCGNEISQKRADELKAHFDKSYNDLNQKLDIELEKIKNYILSNSNLKSVLHDKAVFYDEYRDEYEQENKSLKTKVDSLNSVMLQIEETVKLKKSQITNCSFSKDLDTLISELDNSLLGNLGKINNIIERNNNKTSNFNENISKYKQSIINHVISKNFDNILQIESEIEIIKQRLIRHTKLIDVLAKKGKENEQRARNSQTPADDINRAIKTVFGRDDISLQDMGIGYQLLRNGKPAKKFSKGEENAIALIYFLRSLSHLGIDAKELIVFLDDPISSFDSNFYYNVISYINDCSKHIGQLFILTHKFSVYKDCTVIFSSEETCAFIMRRENNGPALLSENELIAKYHDEYVYIFSQIYRFVKKPPEDIREYYTYPNMARRMLEGFLTFKIPGGAKSSSKVKLLTSGNPVLDAAALRLLNNKSHLRIISKMDGSDDFEGIENLRTTLSDVLEFIKINDPVHYSNVETICRDFYKEVEPDIVEERILKTVKFYDTYPAAAGGGTIMGDEELPFEPIEVYNDKCDFVIKISGDSMEPQIKDGSLAMIKRTPVLDHNQVGIFIVDGNSYCKKLVHAQDGRTLLTSYNKDNYPPIDVTNQDVWTWGLYLGEHTPE